MGLHVDGTWLTPSPMQAVLSAGERPRGQSCCLAWMYIVLFCWQQPVKNIYCECHYVVLVCGQQRKARGGPEILCFALKVPPQLCFLSNRPLKEMRQTCVYVSQLFSETVFIEVFVPALLVDFILLLNVFKVLFPLLPSCFDFFFLL